MKVCIRCKQSLSLDRFSKQKSNKDGHWSTCKDCRSILRKEYYEKNKETEMQKAIKWQKTNPEKKLKSVKKYQKENPEVRKKVIKKWKLKNPEKSAEYSKNWRIKNPEKNKERSKKQASKNVASGLSKAMAAKRRAAKLHRTLPGTDLKAITEFYQNCPKGMVVDHIIPLQGTKISGLHKVENLQYLTPEENGSKWNKFIN